MKHKCIEIEFFPIYFKLTTKVVMNNKFDFEKGFQEKLYIKDGLMKVLVGLLNQLIFNTLIFQLFEFYQGVLT